MPKFAYVVELDPVSIAQLQVAQQLIGAILENIQVVPLAEEGEVDPGNAADLQEGREVDPKFAPPPPMPPMNPQENYGAGPPPVGGLG